MLFKRTAAAEKKTYLIDSLIVNMFGICRSAKWEVKEEEGGGGGKKLIAICGACIHISLRWIE